LEKRERRRVGTNLFKVLEKGGLDVQRGERFGVQGLEPNFTGSEEILVHDGRVVLASGWGVNTRPGRVDVLTFATCP
jgi:hypothetical protein